MPIHRASSSARRVVPVLLAGAALTGAIASSAQPPAQKYLLKELGAPGDVCEVDDTMDMSMDMIFKVGEQETPPLNLANKERKKYVETVLADNDQESAYKRTYSVAHSFTKNPDGKGQLVRSSLEGKTVVVRRRQGKVTVTAAKGKLAAADEKDLRGNASDTSSHMFPDHEVGPGDEWTIDARAFAKGLGDVEKAEMKARFEEVVEQAGHPCARIHFTMNVSGTAKGGSQAPKGEGVPMTMNLAGDGIFMLDLQRPLSLKLTGPVTASGDMKREGVSLHFDGGGTATMMQVNSWRKVAGKPFAAAARATTSSPR